MLFIKLMPNLELYEDSEGLSSQPFLKLDVSHGVPARALPT